MSDETMNAEEWRWLNEGEPDYDAPLYCPQCDQPIEVGDFIATLDEDGNPTIDPLLIARCVHSICPPDPWDLADDGVADDPDDEESGEA